MSKRLFRKTAQPKGESRHQERVSACIDLWGWQCVHVLFTCDCACTYCKDMLSLTTRLELGDMEMQPPSCYQATSFSNP